MVEKELEMFNLKQDDNSKKELVDSLKKIESVKQWIKRSKNWQMVLVIDRQKELKIEEFEKSKITKIRKLEAKWKLKN